MITLSSHTKKEVFMKAFTFPNLSATLLLLLTALTPVTAQVEKTFVQSFNPQGLPVVLADLKGDIQIETWTQPTVRLQLTVRIKNANETSLRTLITTGRYRLYGKSEGTTFYITAPSLRRDAQLNNTTIHEEFEVKVFVPENINLEQGEVPVPGGTAQKENAQGTKSKASL